MQWNWTDPMSRKRTFFIAALGGGLVLLLLGWLIMRVNERERIITAPTHWRGDYSVAPSRVVRVAANAPLTIDGDLTLDGNLSCTDGSLLIIVRGDARITGSLVCQQSDADLTRSQGRGISLVVSGNLTVTEHAHISTNGALEVADDTQLLATSTAALIARYTEATQDSGGPTRLGPFVDDNPTQEITGKIETLAIDQTRITSPTRIPSLFPRAEAATDKAVPSAVTSIAGIWVIGKEVRSPTSEIPDAIASPAFPYPILTLLSLHPRALTLDHPRLIGADGAPGVSDTRTHCSARGGRGGDGAHIVLQASSIQVNGATVRLGHGGTGGSASTPEHCTTGEAIGGDGGLPGNFKFIATQYITLEDFRLGTQIGGPGGSALAIGEGGTPACPGNAGGAVTALAGRGADTWRELAAVGKITGADRIIVSRVTGGKGGIAKGQPGAGGDGTSCTCSGGKGGNATVIGGKGGSATLRLVGSTGEAVGGDGGSASVAQRMGGSGGSCTTAGNGGLGGDGGAVELVAGPGGTGKTGNGVSGRLESEMGGAGGAGGAGCPPGPGGIGGSGAPRGSSGQTGAWTCPHETAPEPPVATSAPERFLLFNKSVYIPEKELQIYPPGNKCPNAYWGAKDGKYAATAEGASLPQPSICGYGPASQPLVTITQETRTIEQHSRTGIPLIDRIVTP